jgi:hypothetical protein
LQCGAVSRVIFTKMVWQWHLINSIVVLDRGSA